jgi:predicted peptidase
MSLPRRLLPLTCLLATSAVLASEPTREIFERPADGVLRLPYLLSLPEGYEADPSKRWPLVIFLHGAGERGENLADVAKHGPPKQTAAGQTFPFILVSPQCPIDEWWTEQPVLELIDSLEEKYRIDPSRIYLTGLSMGGYGTWHFATLATRRFAAIAPVCGGGIPYRMRLIPDLPVWAFHGAKDPVVVLDESARLVEALKKAGNTKVEFTIFPEAGHDSWTEAYANPALYEWLLSHSLSAKP